MSKHTPEPWRHERVETVQGEISYDLWGGPPLSSGQTLIGNVSGVREQDERPSKLDADRIVACVNALAGVDPRKVNGLRSAVVHYQRNPCAATLHEVGRLAVKFFGASPEPKPVDNEDSYRKACSVFEFHAHYDHLQAGAAALTAAEAAIVLAGDRPEGQRFRWVGRAEFWLGKATFEIQELEKGGDEILARGLRERALKVSDDVESFA